MPHPTKVRAAKTTARPAAIRVLATSVRAAAGLRKETQSAKLVAALHGRVLTALPFLDDAREAFAYRIVVSALGQTWLRRRFEVLPPAERGRSIVPRRQRYLFGQQVNGRFCLLNHFITMKTLIGPDHQVRRPKLLNNSALQPNNFIA
jgi:hypothetical protein